MSWLIARHRRHRRMNEVSGRGLYPGPRQHHRCNKAVYGNAVWQRSTPHALTCTTQHRGQHDGQRKPESSRQEHQAGGIDGKSLTELLVRPTWSRNIAYPAHQANQLTKRKRCTMPKYGLITGHRLAGRTNGMRLTAMANNTTAYMMIEKRAICLARGTFQQTRAATRGACRPTVSDKPKTL